jgi:Ca-activated chloride channel family protein
VKFETPWAFLMLLLPAVLVFAASRGCRRPSASFSSLFCAVQAGKSLRQRLLWLPGTLMVMAVLLLVVAVARPQKGEDVVSSSRRGVAIEMLMDISSSMDISLESVAGNMNRIDAAKQVFKDFITGNDEDLSGRDNDIVGLISFARYADTVCPMTTGLPALTTMVDELEVESRPNEDGTAYGDALVLAAARLMKIDESIKSRGREQDLIKSKIIILLTDGENNCGKHLPAQAAALAEEWGIKIYAIFLGNEPAISGNRSPKLTVTQRELLRICDRTGGICRMVYDYDSLRAVYAEIDALEKSELNLFTDTIYRECFQWFTFSALLCLVLSVVLDTTVLRRTP